MAQVAAHNMILKYEKGINDKGEPIFTTQKVKVSLDATKEGILQCGIALGSLLISEPLVQEELVSSLN